MTDKGRKCGNGEITIDGVTDNVDFTVDLRADPLNKGISDRSLWRPVIFDGRISLMPIWVFDILKRRSTKFSIGGEVQKGTVLTCERCSVTSVGVSVLCGTCVSCNISFKVDNPNNDFYLEYKTKEVVDK